MGAPMSARRCIRVMPPILCVVFAGAAAPAAGGQHGTPRPARGQAQPRSPRMMATPISDDSSRRVFADRDAGISARPE